MASTGLPPPPINDSPGSFTWLEWYRQLRSYISTSGSVPWYVIDFAGSNITDIATREHNTLQSTQGGTAGEKYHLTLAEVTATRNTIEYVTPTTGFNNTIADITTKYIIEPAGTLATGTIKMSATPVNGQTVTIASTAEITTLTHSPNTGQTIKGALTTIAANGFGTWIYRTTNTTWYRVA